MMNRLIKITFFIVISLLLSMAVSFADSGTIGIKLDDADIQTDSPPVIINGRTLAPARAVFEAMGGTLEWDAAAREVTVNGEDLFNGDKIMIKLVIDSSRAYINGKETRLDVPARIINDRTMIPVRFVSEAMGCNVTWDEANRMVEITSPVREEDLIVIKSVSLSSNGKKVTVKADTEVADFDSYMMSNPTRLVFDIKGAKLKSDDKVIDTEDNPYIKSIEYSQKTRDSVRITAVLQESSYGIISRSATDRTFYMNFEEGDIDTNPDIPEYRYEPLTDEDIALLEQYGLSPVAEEAREKLVVIDPGHGGNDPGALGKEGGTIVLREKDINLDIGLRVKELLEAAGVHLYMIRTEDITIPLYDRQDIANNLGASLYVSIHNNANNSSSPHGTEVYYRGPNDPTIGGISAVRLAKNLQNTISSNIGTANNGTKVSTGLAVLRRTTMPALIIEGAYISNYNDRQIMKTDQFREQYAVSVAKCIIEELNKGVED